jgi:hypothetical protein
MTATDPGGTPDPEELARVHALGGGIHRKGRPVHVAEAPPAIEADKVMLNRVTLKVTVRDPTITCQRQGNACARTQVPFMAANPPVPPLRVALYTAWPSPPGQNAHDTGGVGALQHAGWPKLLLGIGVVSLYILPNQGPGQ